MDSPRPIATPHAVALCRRHSPSAAIIWPLILVTCLFFLWAVGVNINDILIPHLRGAFHLTDFESSFVQVAFFGGYFLAAWPAGWIVGRLGYQRGIVFGLIICAIGAFLFIPAAYIHVYAAFLLGLFIMACGQSFLEVCANPYVTFLGPTETSERRLNLAQSFNALGAVLTPIFGSALILERTHKLAAGANAAAAEAAIVRLPYLIIVAIFLGMAVLIGLSHLPKISEEPADGDLFRRAARFAFSPTCLRELRRAVLLCRRASRRRQLRHPLR
jgi:FHS family L-fucose permease-like MFS transporter